MRKHTVYAMFFPVVYQECSREELFAMFYPREELLSGKPTSLGFAAGKYFEVLYNTIPYGLSGTNRIILYS